MLRKLASLSIVAVLASSCHSGGLPAQRVSVKSDAGSAKTVKTAENESTSANDGPKSGSKKQKSKKSKTAAASKAEQVDDTPLPTATKPSPLSKLVGGFGQPRRVALPHNDDVDDAPEEKPAEPLHEL